MAAVALALSLLCSPAQVQQGCLYNDGADDGNTTKVILRGKPDRFLDDPCHDDGCRAIKDIICAVNAQGHRLTPNTMAYLSHRQFELADAQYSRNILALGREHPGRIPLYCTLLARVAATLTGDKEHDGWTAHNVVELAIWLDRPRHHCLAQVQAAVPATVQDIDLVWIQNCLPHISACQKEIADNYGKHR